MSQNDKLQNFALDAAVRPIDPGAKFSIVTLSSAQKWLLSWTTDILFYIVVLNLLDEFVESIHIGSFWISILTAVLMKLLLVVVGKLDHVVHHNLHERVLEYVSINGTFLMLFFRKLAIIEIVNAVLDLHPEGTG